jgi:hypothetical protein
MRRPEEKPLLLEDVEDWREGLVLQGASSEREPTLETLRQHWTTRAPKKVIPLMEASMIGERQVAVVAELATRTKHRDAAATQKEPTCAWSPESEPANDIARLETQPAATAVAP